MSFRPVRLLPVALVGLCLATSVVARTKHTSSHHGAAHAGGPALIWRGDVTVAHGVVDDMAKAWQRAGRGSVTVQPFNTASGLDAVRLGSPTSPVPRAAPAWIRTRPA